MGYNSVHLSLNRPKPCSGLSLSLRLWPNPLLLGPHLRSQVEPKRGTLPATQSDSLVYPGNLDQMPCFPQTRLLSDLLFLPSLTQSLRRHYG